MRAADKLWIHELLLSAIELLHKKHSLPPSSTPNNVGSSRAPGEQKAAQSHSEFPRKWNLSCGVFSAKVQETHTCRKVRLRFVCTFEEAVKCGYTLPVISVLSSPTVACSY